MNRLLWGSSHPINRNKLCALLLLLRNSPHGLATETSDKGMQLTFCSSQRLVITNTYFDQQRLKNGQAAGLYEIQPELLKSGDQCFDDTLTDVLIMNYFIFRLFALTEKKMTCHFDKQNIFTVKTVFYYYYCTHHNYRHVYPVAVPVFRRRYTAPAGGKVRQIQKQQQQQQKSEHVIYLWKAEILLIRTM